GAELPAASALVVEDFVLRIALQISKRVAERSTRRRRAAGRAILRRKAVGRHRQRRLGLRNFLRLFGLWVFDRTSGRGIGLRRFTACHLLRWLVDALGALASRERFHVLGLFRALRCRRRTIQIRRERFWRSFLNRTFNPGRHHHVLQRRFVLLLARDLRH